MLATLSPVPARNDGQPAPGSSDFGGVQFTIDWMFSRRSAALSFASLRSPRKRPGAISAGGMACSCSDARAAEGCTAGSEVVNEAQRAHVSNTVASCAALSLDVFFSSDAPPNSS